MGDSSSRGIRLLALYSLVILAACLCASYLGRSRLEVEDIPVGDAAADMLLERVIDDQGYLLTGHYSRFEFNHPGPFFFYVHHVVHRVLDRYGLPASASAYASTMILNVAFLLIGVFLAHRAVGLNPGFWSLLCGVLVVFSMFDNTIYAVWMPAKIILPLFALFFCLVLLVRRRLQYAPLACLLVSVLIHGYVTMIALALPMLLLAIGWGLYRNRRALTAGETRYLVGGALIGLSFAAPMALDCLINEACNPGRIISFAAGSEAPPPELSSILRSVNANVFSGLGVIQFALLLGGAYGLHANEELRRTWKSSLLIATSFVVAFLAYHKLAPGPMFDNMVLFMRALPMALVTLCTVGSFRSIADTGWKRDLHRQALRLGLVVLVIVSVLHLRPYPLRPDARRYVRQLAQGIMSAAGDSAEARIDYENHAQWPTIAGVLFELERNRFRACTTRREMAFLFTERKVCEIDDDPNITLVPAARCDDRCVSRAGGIGIIPLETTR